MATFLLCTSFVCVYFCFVLWSGIGRVQLSTGITNSSPLLAVEGAIKASSPISRKLLPRRTATEAPVISFSRRLNSGRKSPAPGGVGRAPPPKSFSRSLLGSELCVTTGREPSAPRRLVHFHGRLPDFPSGTRFARVVRPKDAGANCPLPGAPDVACHPPRDSESVVAALFWGERHAAATCLTGRKSPL